MVRAHHGPLLKKPFFDKKNGFFRVLDELAKEIYMLLFYLFDMNAVDFYQLTKKDVNIYCGILCLDAIYIPHE